MHTERRSPCFLKWRITCRRPVIVAVIQLDQEHRAADAANTFWSFTQSVQRRNGSSKILPFESFQQTESAGRNRTSRNEHHVFIGFITNLGRCRDVLLSLFKALFVQLSSDIVKPLLHPLVPRYRRFRIPNVSANARYSRNSDSKKTQHKAQIKN